MLMLLTFKVPEEERLDESYWGMPLWERIYFRCLYALSGFLITGSIMGMLGAAIWMQWLTAGLVAFAALIYRFAFPNGTQNAQTWMQEGMLEAAKEMAEKGVTPNDPRQTPEMMEMALEENRRFRAERKAAASKKAAEKKARKASRKNK